MIGILKRNGTFTLDIMIETFYTERFSSDIFCIFFTLESKFNMYCDIIYYDTKGNLKIISYSFKLGSICRTDVSE